MFPPNPSTQNAKLIITLAIAIVSISHTTSSLNKDINYQTVVFENQSCHEGLCIKFNFENINSEWQFLAQPVVPSCCGYTAINVSYLSQVTLVNSPYTMAETTAIPQYDDEGTTTRPQEQDQDDTGLTVNEGRSLQQDSSQNTDNSHSTNTDQNTIQIPEPAAQKMVLANKVASGLARFFKTSICEGKNTIECLANQSVKFITHKAIERQNPPVTTTTPIPVLIKSPCKIDQTGPGCYSWFDLTNKIVAPVLNSLEQFGGYLDKYPSDKNSRWSKVGQNLYLQSISNPPANQELSLPAMASIVLKQTANTQAEVRMARIEATQRGYAQQNLAILLFIPSILMFLLYTALNISQCVKFFKKTKIEKREKKDKKEFSRSQRLKALLEPPTVNPRNRTQATIEMQELV